MAINANVFGLAVISVYFLLLIAPVSAQWAPLRDVRPGRQWPNPRQGSQATYCESSDSIALFGGYSGATDTDFLSDSWRWRFDLNAWNTLVVTSNTTPRSRVWHTLTSMKQRDLSASVADRCFGVVYGGARRSAPGVPLSDLGDVWLADFGTIDQQDQVEWYDVTPVGGVGPGARNEHAADWRRGSVVVFGGARIVAGVGTNFNDVWELRVDPVSRAPGVWTAIDANSADGAGITRPAARFSSSLTVKLGETPEDDRLVVFSGRAYTGKNQDWSMLTDLWIYSYRTGTWQLAPGLPLARSFHAVALVDSTFFVFAGYTRESTPTTTKYFVFSDVLVTDLDGAVTPDEHITGSDSLKLPPGPGCVDKDGNTGLWCTVAFPDFTLQPLARYDHAYAQRGDQLIVFGGRVDELLGDMWMLNMSFNRSSSDRMQPRLVLTQPDNLSKSDIQSTLYFMVSILSLIVMCFFIFVATLRRYQRNGTLMPGPAGATGAPRAGRELLAVKPEVIAALPLLQWSRTPGPRSPEAGRDPEDLSHEVTNEMCAICLCDYEEGVTLKELPCRHLFHPDCIDVWLGRNNLCPLCKQIVDVSSPAEAPASPPPAAHQVVDVQGASATPTVDERIELTSVAPSGTREQQTARTAPADLALPPRE